jgi:hypothetical protein
MFHTDNATFFNIKRLEAEARATVSSSSLIQRCVRGDRAAIIALKTGFWPFTRDFEKAINHRINSAKLPREELYQKFGRAGTGRSFVDNGRTRRKLEEQEMSGAFNLSKEQLQEMQKDEKKHSAHWLADARQIGLTLEQLEAAPVAPAVQMLIDGTKTENLVELFAQALASTEFIAEELGDQLAKCEAYKGQFARGRAIWMEVHTIPHDGEPSHEDIVLDFARAYDKTGDPLVIEEMVIRGIRMFGIAADEVEARFAPRSLVAAE